MNVKIELLIEIIESVSEKCFFKATDYMGFLDKKYFNQKFQDFNYKKYGLLIIPLNTNNKKELINYLKKVEVLFFQEIHIICNEKILLESYDGFDAGVTISKSIRINIEKYRKEGIDIGFFTPNSE